MNIRRCCTVTVIPLALCGLLAVSAPPEAEKFDEKAWRSKVLGVEPALLSAPNIENGRYLNPWMPMEHAGFSRMIKWRLTRKAEYTDEEKTHLPAVLNDAPGRIAGLNGGDFILWIGHASFLIRAGGEYWLTDPIFSKRALLPARMTPPGMTAREVNELGGKLNVVISHNHYDHLDSASIRELREDARFFVPKGLGDYVRSLGKKDVVEMDWWEERDLGGGRKMVCLPMQHWSLRMGQGRNTTLWASFLIITPGRKVYFAGDSGYFIGYREIGRRWPGIDYVLMPVTAYHPRWFMHYAHMNADEALDAFADLGARHFIPTQWGTFHLGDEPPGYPALDLRRKIRERGLDTSRFHIMDIGGIVEMR